MLCLGVFYLGVIMVIPFDFPMTSKHTRPTEKAIPHVSQQAHKFTRCERRLDLHKR